jgi:hypothetical protein
MIMTTMTMLNDAVTANDKRSANCEENSDPTKDDMSSSTSNTVVNICNSLMSLPMSAITC